MPAIVRNGNGAVRAGEDRSEPGKGQPFSPLIDAKTASRLLGVPPTWLLAQARERKIPHHRLGHYVRFSAEELADWLEDTRVEVRPRGAA